MSPEDFFGNLVNFWRQHSALPAARRVSLTDSSASTFLNHNRYPGSVNATIDYYDAGMLASFDLDVALRLREPAGSLDEIAAALFDRHAGRGEGLTHAQARALILERAPELAELIEREIERPGGLAAPRSLERLGFEVVEQPQPYLGVVLVKETGPQLADVLDDSPAARAGLAPGDEIERAGGFAFGLKALRWLVANEPRFCLEVKRGQRRLELQVEPGRLPRVTALRWRGTAAQRAVIEAMLGQPWRPEPGQSIPLTAHHNFHGLQTVV
jgi:predicted metalloprotease with PDZ domain